MGVLYEHWRTDLKECFYVGASWHNPESRPYEMYNRHENHIKAQNEIKNNGGLIEVRIIECSHLNDQELGDLEILQISYWRDLIGDRLINISKGGHGVHLDWTEERRQSHSDCLTQYYSTNEGRKLIEDTRPKNSEGLKKFAQTEEGAESYKNRGLKISQLRNSVGWLSEHENFGNKISGKLIEYAKTECGIEDYNMRGPKIGSSLKSYFNSPKGRAAAIMHSWWLSNVRDRKYWGA